MEQTDYLQTPIVSRRFTRFLFTDYFTHSKKGWVSERQKEAGAMLHEVWLTGINAKVERRIGR